MRHIFSPSYAGALSESAEVSPLQRYAYHGDLANVQKCLDEGADPNISDTDGETPLSAAAYNGHLDVMKLLIERGASVNHIVKPRRASISLVSIGKPEMSIMTLAINRCQFEAAKLLVMSKALFGYESIMLRIEYCQYCLKQYRQEAASNPDLLAYVNAINEAFTQYQRLNNFEQFYSELTTAHRNLGAKLSADHPARVLLEGFTKWLLSRFGASLMKVSLALQKKDMIFTLLQMTEAEIRENWLSSEYIINRICRLFKINEACATNPEIGQLETGLVEFMPIREKIKAFELHKVTLLKHLDDLLKPYQLPTEAETPDIEKALRRAASKGVISDVSKLLEYDPDINARDTGVHHRSALHWAVINKHESVVKLLLAKGANPDLKDSSDKSARDYAQAPGYGKLKIIFDSIKTEDLEPIASSGGGSTSEIAYKR